MPIMCVDNMNMSMRVGVRLVSAGGGDSLILDIECLKCRDCRVLCYAIAHERGRGHSFTFHPHIGTFFCIAKIEIAIVEKEPTKAFSLLKVPTSAFAIKNLLRHNATI